MAFATKNDYCGLVAATTTNDVAALAVRDETENRSVLTYEPIGEDGSILTTEVYGDDATPNNTYALKSNLSSFTGFKLGSLQTVSAKKYVTKSIKISTAVNAAVTISADAEQVEDSATADATQNYALPSLSLTTAMKAQNVFGCFTLTGTGVNLTKLDVDASMSIQKDTLVGVNIASGYGSAKVTVTGTVLVADASATPTLAVATGTAGTGWVISQPLTCTNPETAYRTFTFKLEKALARTGSSST